MEKDYGRSNVAIFGYGSLLTCPGTKIADHIIDRRTCPSPWPIEYARRSQGRGGGPTLVIYASGGIVQGQILVLDVPVARIREVRKWLREREGNPPSRSIKKMQLNGLDSVLYCDLDGTIADEDMKPEILAKFAIESVRKSPAKNGIRYLAQNVDRGIITPLTIPYRDAILRLTQADDLYQAESMILSLATEERVWIPGTK